MREIWRQRLGIWGNGCIFNLLAEEIPYKMDEIRILRNRKIREEYREQYQKGFRHEVIVEKLIPKYALARLTLEAIVFQKGVYKDA